MASLAEMAAQSNQIAQQNNPNFAALNTIIQGRTIPLNGFGDFLQKTIEPARQRRHEASENLLNRQHTSSENLLNRQHLSAENEQNRRHNLDLENLRNKLAKDLENYRHNYNKELVNLQHSNAVDLNSRNQNNELEKLGYQYYLDLAGKFHDERRQDDLHNRQVDDQYILLGGRNDPATMTPLQKRQAIYSLKNQPSTTQSSQTNIITVPDFKENRTTETRALSTNQGLLINPPTSVGGKITVQDLPNLATLYPNLSTTPEGRAFLSEVNEALITNRENIQALQPLVDRFNRGELPLLPPVPKYTDFYSIPKDPNAVRLDKTLGTASTIVPDFAKKQIQFLLGNPMLSRNEARKDGIALPRLETKQYHKNLWGDLQRMADNYELNKQLASRYEEAELAQHALGKMGASRFYVSPNDNVLNEARRAISDKLGIYDPEAVLTFVDGNGSFVFAVNGHIFRMNNGTVHEVEY